MMINTVEDFSECANGIIQIKIETHPWIMCQVSAIAASRHFSTHIHK